MEFNDAIREGDGGRIIRCWRYFLLLFKANKCANYAIEAFTLLVQFDFLLPHRQARQLHGVVQSIHLKDLRRISHATST